LTLCVLQLLIMSLTCITSNIASAQPLLVYLCVLVNCIFNLCCLLWIAQIGTANASAAARLAPYTTIHIPMCSASQVPVHVTGAAGGSTGHQQQQSTGAPPSGAGAWPFAPCHSAAAAAAAAAAALGQHHTHQQVGHPLTTLHPCCTTAAAPHHFLAAAPPGSHFYHAAAATLPPPPAYHQLHRSTGTTHHHQSLYPTTPLHSDIHTTQHPTQVQGSVVTVELLLIAIV